MNEHRAHQLLSVHGLRNSPALISTRSLFGRTSPRSLCKAWLLLAFPFAQWCLCPGAGLGGVRAGHLDSFRNRRGAPLQPAALLLCPLPVKYHLTPSLLGFAFLFNTKNLSVPVNEGSSCSKMPKFIFSGDRWIDETSTQQCLN